VTGQGSHDGRRHAIVALDTATRIVVVAIGLLDGEAIGISSWEAGFRHGETLLPSLSRFLGETNVRRSRIDGLIVGTGPGAFTGLRVGVATAKGLAHALDKPIVGIPTGEALLEALAHETGEPREAFALLLPAGPADRVLVRSGERPLLLPGGEEPALRDERLVALDLEGRAPEDALALGGRALGGLGRALLRLGAARLAAGDADDLERLVPEYVTLPRGVMVETGEVAWSRGPR
jgi:hypothetical protein